MVLRVNAATLFIGLTSGFEAKPSHRSRVKGDRTSDCSPLREHSWFCEDRSVRFLLICWRSPVTLISPQQLPPVTASARLRRVSRSACAMVERRSMPVTFRLRDVPPALELRLREAVDGVLDGNWCVTLSQSHLDGQWYLQLDSLGARSSVSLPSTNLRVRDVEALLRRLSALARHRAPVADEPPPDQHPLI